MAYMSQEHKAELAPAIKAVLKKYNVKGSLSVDNHSTLVLTISAGEIDFINDYKGESDGHIQVNTSWYDKHFTGTAAEFLGEVIPLMRGPRYYDESDMMTDYCHCSHYVGVNIGRWNKPYKVYELA